MTPLIDIQNLDISLGGRLILSNVSFQIEKGKTVGLVGPNGGGKTTLVKAILGLVTCSKGHIHKKKNIRFGYLPQRPPQPLEFPITVKEALKLYQANDKKSLKLLKRLGLEHVLLQPLKKLSGGETQKLFLLIALASDPDIVILDEPTSNIDQQADRDLQTILQEEKTKGKSVVIISHDIDTVAKQADQIVCLNQTVCCRGKPHLVIRSKEFQNMFGDAHYHHPHE